MYCLQTLAKLNGLAAITDNDTIDLTPTWGEIGTLVMRLAMSGETKALAAMKNDVAKAFASAQALRTLHESGLVTPQMNAVITGVLATEMHKQGV